MRKDEKKVIKIKKPQKQKIVVEQGRVLIGEPVDYKVLYTELVESLEKAKERIAELKEQYKDVEALSVHYFGI